MRNVVERVLNTLIYLLESPHPVTAEEIRRTVPGYSQDSDEAFHRMFERDKELLRQLGVPIKLDALDVWEVDFGYTVDPDEYAIPDPGLTPEERAALSLAARIVQLGGSHAGLDGLRKLGGVEQGVAFEPFGADLGAEGETLGAVFDAVVQRSPIEFTYREGRRKLNPYGIAFRRGHWYLVGVTTEGERVYRIDRISAIDKGEPGGFERPAGFNPSTFLQSQPWEAGGDEEVKATVRFDPEVAWWASRTLGVEHSEGHLEVTIPVSNRDAFVGWVLSFGPSAEILAPEELRRDLMDRVTAAVDGVVA
ncbi:MAG: WYL domain-containing protein [Actinobacteria bacterium]|nr:MAG: WYL domain-containing protein [Actinomycetota bacterium]REK35513.1 MAG: WYL domain-containing protein [Actinomycetota bacterium]